MGVVVAVVGGAVLSLSFLLIQRTIGARIGLLRSAVCVFREQKDHWEPLCAPLVH